MSPAIHDLSEASGPAAAGLLGARADLGGFAQGLVYDAARQRPPSEWEVLGRYLKQMTGHDLDSYAHLVAVLKHRFARLDNREVWDRLRFEEGCIGMEMHQRGYDPPTRIWPGRMAPITSHARS